MKTHRLTLMTLSLPALFLCASTSAQSNTPPSITQQPMGLTVLAGTTNIAFTVGASGTPPLSYQWELDGANIADATNSSYTVDYTYISTLPEPPLDYNVVVSNAFGTVTSAVAVLTVDVPLYIVTQPQSLFVYPFTNVTFTVTALGTAPLSYQWRSNGIPIAANASGTNYTVIDPQLGPPINYDVVIANSSGSVTSKVAVLTVQDFSQPAIQAPQGAILARCTSPAGAIVNFTITATDPYDPAPTVTCTPPSGSIFPIGYTSVMCVAKDHLGNSTTGFAQVEVVGRCDAGCIKLNVPNDIYVWVTNSSTAQVSFIATAMNTCSGMPYPVFSLPPSGSQFPIGTNVVMCVASATGLSISNQFASVTNTFRVIVIDTNPPVVLTPGDVVICAPVGASSVPVYFSVQANDPGGLPVTITAVPPSGSIFPIGLTTVNVTATDTYGNSAATTFAVLVEAAPPYAVNDPDWGFEDNCGLGGWMYTGFKGTNGQPLVVQPVVGDLFQVSHISSLQQQLNNNLGGDYWPQIFWPEGHKGQRWVCTADVHVYGPPPQGNLNDMLNDTLMGTIVSVDFVISNDCISFLIGGGNDSQNLTVDLLVQDPAGTIVVNGTNYRVQESATGNGQEAMRRAWFGQLITHLALGGKHARIRINDNSRVGHLNVDDFQFSNVTPDVETVSVRPPSLSSGGVPYPAVVTTDGINFYDWDSAVWGFADMHTHPMSCLGFGQKLFHGSPDGAVFNPGNNPEDFTNGLSNCNPDHGGWGLDNGSGDYWRNLIVNQTDQSGDNHNEGYDPQPFNEFRKWPVFDTSVHQQMWFDWMKRAYNGGERVMVALCVNNEMLNAISKGNPGAPIDDMSVGDLQIQEMKQFVARHSDFMAIAYDPVQLRSIVRSNLMAIVLGIELDDFGNIVQDPGVTTNSPLTAYSKTAVTSAIEHLYNEGVRYAFTVHLADNKFGGTGSESDMLGVASKFLNHGDAIQVTPATAADDIQLWMDNIELSSGTQALMDALGVAAIGAVFVVPPALAGIAPLIAPFVSAIPLGPAAVGLAGMGVTAAAGIVSLVGLGIIVADICPNCALDAALFFLGVGDTSQFNNANLMPINGNYPNYPTCEQAPYGVRNVRGLSPLGLYAVEEMMKRGIMLDVDHMSQAAVGDAFSIATNVPDGYPLNSGHNGYREINISSSENSRSTNQLPVLQQLGGMLGVGWEDSPSGFFTHNFSDIVPQPHYSSSSIANDCAGTSKTWAQEYLYAVEKFQGSNVAFGTDADGFIQFPGPRFGPQSAYGLISNPASSDTNCVGYDPDVYLRSSQILAQRNGVRYASTTLLTTAAFTGQSVDYNQDPMNGAGSSLTVNTANGYQYDGEQADFYAAINIYNYFQNAVAGGLSENALKTILGQVQNGLSPNYNNNGLGFNVFDNSHQRRIKEFALGLLKGIKGWNAEDDCGVQWVWPAQALGIAVYDAMVLNNYSAAYSTLSGFDLCNDGGNQPTDLQLQDLLIPVWNDYQQAFGTNVPMINCQTDNKLWDINFEGVAHYGLIPDFLQDLHNVGMQPQDMSILFRSANNFAAMWTRSIAGSVAFGPPQFYYEALDGHGNVLLSFTHGDNNYVVQQNSDFRNPSGWVNANVIATQANPVTSTVTIPLSSCASCGEYFRLVSAP